MIRIGRFGSKLINENENKVNSYFVVVDKNKK